MCRLVEKNAHNNMIQIGPPLYQWKNLETFMLKITLYSPCGVVN
jgi:hypothetical protein